MKEFGRARQEKFIMWLVFPLLLLWSLTFIYLFIWAFLNSLKEIPEYYANSFALPNKWLFSNWKAAFESLEVPKSNPLYRANLWDMLINSLWYTLGGLAAQHYVRGLSVICCFKISIQVLRLFVQFDDRGHDVSRNGCNGGRI